MVNTLLDNALFKIFGCFLISSIGARGLRKCLYLTIKLIIMRKKSISQLSKMAQKTADKLIDFHDDSILNKDVNKIVDYNKIIKCVEHLENIVILLSKY